MIRNTVLRAASLLAFSAVLVGCSSGPSESDVRRAIEANIDSTNQQMAELVGQDALDKVGRNSLTDLDLLGCEESGESYRCDVVMSMDTPLMPINDRSLTLRVRKTDNGWKLMEGL